MGIPRFSNEDLDEIANKLNKKLFDYIEDKEKYDLLTDSSIIIRLSQDENNILTFSLDLETAGALEKEELKTLHQELAKKASDWLEEELLCRKNSMK